MKHGTIFETMDACACRQHAGDCTGSEFMGMKETLEKGQRTQTLKQCFSVTFLNQNIDSH